MKKRILFTIIILTIFFTKAFSQLPVVSTDEDPFWYYIQVEGESDRANLVFTAQNNKVHGKTMDISLEETKLAPQLWRFEVKNNKYTIINKATGKKIDADYDSQLGISNMTLTENTSAEWEFSENGNFFNIKSTKVPSGGNSSNVYAHQANNYGNRNYVIMLEGSGYNGTPNSKFKFVEYEKSEIEYSTDNEEIWYYICSANPEYTNKCITDATRETLPDIHFTLETTEEKNEYQQWKVVKKSTSATEQYVHFINKATRNLIQAKSVPNEFYKYTQATTDISADKGWINRYLGRGQFEISGEEEDGVIRYLNASTSENRQPDFYDPDAVKNTSFAWFFRKVEDFWTDIPSIDGESDCRIYSRNRYIIVEGCDDYTIHSMEGIKINKDKQLPVGIYLVTAHGKTIKLFVK